MRGYRMAITMATGLRGKHSEGTQGSLSVRVSEKNLSDCLLGVGLLEKGRWKLKAGSRNRGR